KKATNHLSRLLEKSVHETESSSSSEEDDKDHNVKDELFQALYETPAGMKKTRFLREKLSKKNFLQGHTSPIPSSAAVERMFSMGKDILRPKRSRMSDKHFEMLSSTPKNKYKKMTENQELGEIRIRFYTAQLCNTNRETTAR
ncbi:hypothetical protein Hamer_G025660, partial [Homarus americanus]